MTNFLIPSAYSAEDILVDIKTPAIKDNFFGYSCIGNLVSSFVSAAFVVSAVVFFLFLVMGGIEWISSGGDKGKVEQAQKRITNALIGLTIVAASYAIFSLVIYFFGIDLSSLCGTSGSGNGGGKYIPD